MTASRPSPRQKKSLARLAKLSAFPPPSGRGRDPKFRPTISNPALLIDGSDHMYRQFVHELLSLSAMHEAIRNGIAACVDLGGVQHTILQSIRHLSAVQPVAVRDVAEQLGLSGAFITIETTKLQERGLLDKRPSTSDKRKVSLVLTKDALALFNRLAPLQQSIGDVQFGCLSEKEFRALVPIVARLVETSREALLLLAHLTAESKPSFRGAPRGKEKSRSKR
jgi:DNA-binding MarR family transcriptional regulator